ncbi:LOW QUALITY PROTEIN: transcriptional protein SWT1-like [Metopolophium dirhodum]|uniref:LOW QUALITY PROTEIN: transcriptional protein SWT1-like n=1 Tax=Metopolophium dirhodum TaxID=44670 RepID=UPI00299072A3|nr:LOW QUALITY PROTEIN: transcriptional protein SWT1-like [Metopolophium dirhodum]
MEKNNQKRSVLESSKNNIFGYTIEIGNTTYENTLEERIQAAKNASSSAKRAQNQNIEEKLLRSRNAKEYINVQNMPVIKSMSSAQESKITNKQWSSINKTDIQTSTHIPLPKNLTKTKNINSNFEPKCNTSFLKQTFKGGGSMQLRLEAIKANKKLSNRISHECSNTLESHNPSKNVSLQYIPLTKNHSSKLSNTNNFKRNEYKTRSTVQKHLEEVKYTGHCDRTKDITNTPYKSVTSGVTSVQNRLISAREQMTAKSKDNNEFNVSKCGIIKNPSTCELDNIRHDTNTLGRNNKNKIKRLNQPNESIKKKKPGLVSTTKKIILNNNSSVNKCIDQRLMNVQQKPIVPILNNMISSSSSSASETIVSTKLGNRCILTNSKSKEIDSFSFVRPQTSCNRQAFEIKKNTQFNNDESMEWEDIIETDDIVEKVNNLRRTKHEYEPMEWTPDSIMHCDRINYCLVIDTNILLSDLKSITILIDKYLTDYGYPTIVLPWQVLKELDCIKNGENLLGYRAREATRWLLDMLSKRHPRLKGQPMTKKSSLSSDDDILRCAITVKERVNIVYLVTDDKILSIKSEVNGISVKNSLWLQNLVTNTNQNNSDIFQEAVKNYPIIENNSIMKFEPHLEHIIVRVLKCAVRLNNKYSILKQKLWWEIYSLSKPFSLTQLLVKLKDHWNIIAPHQLLKAPKKQLDCMEYFFNDLKQISPEISLSWTEFYNFLKYSTETIIALPYEYYHITDVLLYDLMKARRYLKQKLDCTTLGDKLFYPLSHLSISNNNAPNIDNILHNISKKVDTFCSCVYNDNGFKRNSSENELKCGVLKTINVDERIKDYCYKLSNIIKIMLKINVLKTEEILESHIIIDAFLKAITEFNDDFVNLNKQNVVDFCLLKYKNSFFHILLSFQNNLAAMKNLITTIKS